MGKDKADEKFNDKSNDNQNESELSDNDSPSNQINEDESENKYEEKIDELQNQVNDYKDSLLRKVAEFENYKRRTENDQLNLVNYAAESFIKKLLPIVDDLERSLAHMSEETDTAKIKEGIQLIYSKLLKTFNEQDIKKIEAVGNEFNVDYHEALMQKVDDSVPPHTVIEELETGYTYKDRVIRHSKVIVSDQSPTNQNNEE